METLLMDIAAQAESVRALARKYRGRMHESEIRHLEEAAATLEGLAALRQSMLSGLGANGDLDCDTFAKALVRLLKLPMER